MPALKPASRSLFARNTAVSSDELRDRLESLLQDWRKQGLPPRWTVEQTLRELIAWRDEAGIAGLFSPAPRMFTATLDDGWGHGLEIIHLCAGAAGMEILHLGLLLSPESIMAACHENPPDFLGLTMLHSDSEPALLLIAENLPAGARLVAGGPPFKWDPELAERAHVHHVSASVADFLELILSLR